MSTISPHFNQVMKILRGQGYQPYSPNMPHHLGKCFGAESVIVGNDNVRFVPAKGATSEMSHAAFIAQFSQPFGTNNNPFAKGLRR